MQKTRLEGLSDAAFAIIFTLLAIEIRVPEDLHRLTDSELLHALGDLTPLFIGYFVSFAVLAMFWISHNALYGYVIKEINRQLIGINIVYLMFASLIPFSSHLLGRYGELPLAVLIYGANVFAIGIVGYLAFMYALRSKEIDTTHVDARMIAQAKVRLLLTPSLTLVGMICAFFSIPLALFFYAFPILFNVIPGTLDAAERVFNFRLGRR